MIIVRIILGVVVCLVLMIVSINLIGRGWERNVNKNMIFECGIIRDKLSRKSFSLRFFLFIILFLVFEIEIILFLPCRILQDFLLAEITGLLIWIVFFLGTGLLYEWGQGALTWVFNDK